MFKYLNKRQYDSESNSCKLVVWLIVLSLLFRCDDYEEGRGAMAKGRSFANVTACRAVSNPAWCRIFREISCFSPLYIGTLFRCCVLGQGTLLSVSHASLDSGVNEYLVGQRLQCVRLVFSTEMAASTVCSKKGV